MKRFTLFLLFSISFYAASGQRLVTENPSIQRRETDDTFIDRVVLEGDYTILYMRFVSSTLDDRIDDFFRKNPRLERQFRSLDVYSKREFMRRLTEQLAATTSSISIQPSSFLQGKNGNRYRFLKATNIPVAPSRRDVEDGRTYRFVVYYERLEPGVELIDLFEGRNSPSSSMTYWNFYGIRVKNPASQRELPPPAATSPQEPPITANKPAPVVTETDPKITLTGKVLDAVTNQPVAAAIRCEEARSSQLTDSLITSRSGSYEFILSPKNYTYYISANGYEVTEEAVDLSSFKKSTSLNRNFYLNPKKVAALPTPVEVAKPDSVKIEVAKPIEVKPNTFVLDKVYFNTGDSRLLPASFPQLDGLVAMLKSEPTQRVRIEGHTDNRGEPDLNKRLSLQRAFAVREYLVSKGIAANRVEFTGYGDTRPIAANDSDENRQLNRRVEFILLDK